MLYNTHYYIDILGFDDITQKCAISQNNDISQKVRFAFNWIYSKKNVNIWIRDKWKRWEYQTTWSASSEICMQIKRQQLKADMEQWTGSKLRKEYVKVLYCHLAYLTSMQSTSHEMPVWMKHKLESRLQGEISITSDMQMTPPYGRKWRGTKKPLDNGERREWKSWLKTQHSKKKPKKLNI